MEPFAAIAQGPLRAIVRPGDKPIQRHRYIYTNFSHNISFPGHRQRRARSWFTTREVGDRTARVARTTLGLLPVLLAAERCLVEEVVRAADRLEAAGVDGVRVEDALILAHQAAPAGCLDELAAPLEEVEQAGLAVRTLEDVLLLDPDHRQPAPFGVQRVPLPGEFLLLGQQFLAGSEPLVSGHYMRKIPLAFCHDDLSFDSDRVLAAITRLPAWVRRGTA